MGLLSHFSIPFRGLKSGTHQFDFQLDSHFFKAFESSPIEEGAFEVKLQFDKRPSMFILDIGVEGWTKAVCDRCSADIQLPVSDQQQLIIKFGEEPSEDPLVEHIHPDAQDLNVARYIYEYVCLALPMTNVYDCRAEEPIPCNEDILKYMESEESEVEEENESDDNPIWEELKKFNNKN
ncbi:MAG: YceD family protein [Bacteroidota bacterium]